MSAPTELDDETRARLRWEAERLAAEQGIGLPEARRIVWADYLDELAATPPLAAIPDSMPAPPQPVVATSAHPVREFWDARNEIAFTPEWVAANKARLAQVKRLIGSGSK